MAPRLSPELQGVALTVFATCLFGLMDGLSKLLLLEYPLPLIVWLRHLLAAPLVFVMLRIVYGRMPDLRSRRPGLQFVRSALLVLQIAIAFVAFRAMPIGEVQTIFATTPLVVMALSARLLGEPAGFARTLSVLVGLVGILVMLRPGFAELHPAALVACLGIFVYAGYQLLTRVVGRLDPAPTSFALQAVFSAMLTTLVGPWFWRPVDLRGWLLIVAVAVIGSIGHYSLVRALSLAPAPVIQPFLYVHIVFGTLFGWLLFGELPDRWAVAGAALIVGAGVFASWHEARRQRAS